MPRKHKAEPTTEAKIEAIVATMAGWDHDELLAWAQDRRRELLQNDTAEAVHNDWLIACDPYEEE